MREIIRIVEGPDALLHEQFDPADEHAFMTGECHALAIALHKLTGEPMAAVVIRRGRTTEIAHVMLGDANGDILTDIEGERELPEIIDSLDFDPNDESFEVVPATEADILRWIRYKKLPSITPSMQARADAAAVHLLKL
jgi:hypothetical protein